MRIVEDIKFAPVQKFDTQGKPFTIYLSSLIVEVSGQIFRADREMTPAEYDTTFPALRDFIHRALRNAIMVDIRKKLFEGVTE